MGWLGDVVAFATEVAEVLGVVLDVAEADGVEVVDALEDEGTDAVAVVPGVGDHAGDGLDVPVEEEGCAEGDGGSIGVAPGGGPGGGGFVVVPGDLGFDPVCADAAFDSEGHAGDVVLVEDEDVPVGGDDGGVSGQIEVEVVEVDAVGALGGYFLGGGVAADLVGGAVMLVVWCVLVHPGVHVVALGGGGGAAVAPALYVNVMDESDVRHSGLLARMALSMSWGDPSRMFCSPVSGWLAAMPEWSRA